MTWLRIDAEFLASNPGTDGSRALRLQRYFDGGIPDWNLLAQIPHRTLSRSITNKLLSAQMGQLHIVLGASGEGKSTLIRQIAVDVAKASASWEVYYRDHDSKPEPDAGRPLHPDRQYLFVSDNAYEVAQACYDAAERLGARGNAHFLLAARGVDWQEHGRGLAWRSLGLDDAEYLLRGVDESEAEEIVEAWARHGALGRLANYNTVEERKQALYRAARYESFPGESSLLGGMLRVRYGERLDAYVDAMLKRLMERDRSTGSTLARAFLLIAALHARNVKVMTPALLAEALHVPAATIRGDVINPLAEEAAGTREGDSVLVRHRAVAESAMRVAPTLPRTSVPELYGSLVRAAYALRRKRVPVDIGAIRYLSEKLAKDASKELAGDVESAIHVATVCVEEEPNDLQTLVNLLIALHEAGRWKGLASRAEAAVPGLHAMHRVAKARRRFYYEWAFAEGKLERPAIDVWLTAIALADSPHAEQLDSEAVETRLAGLGSPLRVLAEKYWDEKYARGLWAVVVLLKDLPKTPKTSRHLDQFTTAAKALPLNVRPRSVLDSKDDLVAAVKEASQHPERVLPKAVPPGDTLTFRTLFGILD